MPIVHSLFFIFIKTRSGAFVIPQFFATKLFSLNVQVVMYNRCLCFQIYDSVIYDGEFYSSKNSITTYSYFTEFRIKSSSESEIPSGLIYFQAGDVFITTLFIGSILINSKYGLKINSNFRMLLKLYFKLLAANSRFQKSVVVTDPAVFSSLFMKLISPQRIVLTLQLGIQVSG